VEERRETCLDNSHKRRRGKSKHASTVAAKWKREEKGVWIIAYSGREKRNVPGQ
jgi:hypothetical protein